MYYTNAEHFKSLSGYVIDGLWYPRVTKIVDIKSKPALYKFYAETGFVTGEKVKTQSASEGTLIHETAEKILIGETPNIDPTIAPSIEALQIFLETKNQNPDTKIEIIPEFIEKRVVNYGERYAGTIDSLAIIGGRLGVLDIKTSYAVFRDYNLQVSAYLEALKPDLKNISTAWVLRIDQIKTCLKCGATLRQKGGRDKIRLVKKNGKGYNCERHEWSPLKGDIELKEITSLEKDFKAFIGAKHLWEWENEYWLNEVGYL